MLFHGAKFFRGKVGEQGIGGGDVDAACAVRAYVNADAATDAEHGLEFKLARSVYSTCARRAGVRAIEAFATKRLVGLRQGNGDMLSDGGLDKDGFQKRAHSREEQCAFATQKSQGVKHASVGQLNVGNGILTIALDCVVLQRC